MRGCLGWLCNSSDCHLVIPEPGGLSPLARISAPELESEGWGGVFRLGVGALRVSRRLSRSSSLYSSDIPEAHTGIRPCIQPYHTFCDPGSTCGLPRVHYGGIRTTLPYFTKADMHGIPMAHPEHTLGIPAAHPEYALDTPISFFRYTLGTPGLHIENTQDNHIRIFSSPLAYPQYTRVPLLLTPDVRMNKN